MLRTRRNDFYYRNGVRPTEMACALFGVPLNILFFETASESPESEAGSLRNALEAIYRFMFPLGVYSRHVEWL